jgi:hypothetical protein
MTSIGERLLVEAARMAPFAIYPENETNQLLSVVLLQGNWYGPSPERCVG